ncbi:MAG: helix-turn-helix transcriptional regulator [Dactylosporangium sp.]|nr:helix-turn-helix domain-containing protein [Dactylosporangium sp.]NNJ60735.1 helix-turn-helix transcriptional regulator [Dactylosporangium sp.]
MARSSGTFGTEMYRRRTARKMSLASLARMTFYSKGHLSKVENGRKAPSPELVRAVDLALAANGALLALAAADHVVPETGGIDSWWVMGGGPDGNPVLASVACREVLDAPTLSVIDPRPRRLLPPRTDELPARLWTGWLADVRRLGQCADPRNVLPTVLGQLQSVIGFARSARGADRAELYITASRYAEYAGWMLQEAGANAQAQRLTQQAIELAAAGGDRTMARHALTRQALMALYDGDHVTTVRLASRAAADTTMPPRLRGLAALRQAQGYALGGRSDKFERTMEHAKRLLARQAGERCATALGGSAIADPAAATRGWALYDLGRHQECAVILEREIRRIPGDARRAYARYATRCALAHAEARDLEPACDLTRTLLPWIGDLGSTTIRQDLRQLARRLRRWSGHELVHDLLPDLKLALI